MAHAPKLSTREQRKKLACRERPYWQELRRGLSVGYRRTSTESAGAWLLREYKGGTRYVQRRLGVADDLLPADGAIVLSWGDAQRLALADSRPTLTRRARYTVQGAFDDYAATRQTPLGVRELATWRRFIEPVLGTRAVGELTPQELNQWLQSQLSAHGERAPRKAPPADEREAQRRRQYTANRRWGLLRAILNHAFRIDAVQSDAAWRKVRPFRNADRPRTVVATVEQARAILEHLTGPMRGFAAGALFTGMRLGELMALRVQDVDLKAARIHIQHAKSGHERYIPLTVEAVAFFAQQVEGKPRDALVLTPLHADPAVHRVYVSRAMREASEALGIVPAVHFHDLRRTWGSLMLNSGAPLEIIQQVLGHADTRMTRRTYAHLLQGTVAQQVQAHLPNFTTEPQEEKPQVPPPVHARDR